MRYLLVVFVFSLVLVVGCTEQSQPAEDTNTQPSVLPEAKDINKQEEAQINWQTIEGGKYLSVPYYYQKDVPVYGSYACGPTSLKMVLEYKKQTGELDTSVPSISELIELLNPQSDRWQDGDVYFIQGFGVDDIPLARLAENEFGLIDSYVIGAIFQPAYPASQAIDPTHQGQIMDTSDWTAPIDVEGMTIDKLYEEVENGNPVIVDITVNYTSSGLYSPYYDSNGKKHWEVKDGQGHFAVVVGFKNWDTENAQVILLDPLNNDEPTFIELDQFLASWQMLNYQGMIIK